MVCLMTDEQIVIHAINPVIVETDSLSFETCSKLLN